VREHFDEKELVELTLAIVTINGWNRIGISLGADVGSYMPRNTHTGVSGERRDRAAP
jgi:hypothetical protein